MVLCGLCGSYASAGEIELLTNKLAEKGVISYGEAQQIMTETKEAARKELAAGKIETLPSWIQNLSVKGDLRLRQQIDMDSSKSYNRIRERIRMRLGFETRASEKMKAGFGLATGSEKISDKTVTGTAPAGIAAGPITGGTVAGDSIIDAEPSSTNHTLANGFGKAVVLFDYAYIEYSPLSYLNVTAGKMKAGKQVWNPTDLLWDTDINPDGVAVNIKKDMNEKVNFFANASWLVFNEKNSTANAPDAYIVQPGLAWKPSEKIGVKAAYAVQTFNVKGKNTGFYGTPAFDYVCANPSVDVSFNEIIGVYSAGVFGDMVANSAPAPTADKNGSAFGVSFGDAKVSKFGQWKIKYVQRRLESNAWLAKLGDSDAYGGALNSSGYEAALELGLTKSASLGIDYYSMDKINGATTTTPKSLVQFDLVYKF